MDSAQIGFLILHYKNFKITDRCISSILALDKAERARIIVVDNGSCNGSAKLLLDKYKNEQRIDILILEQGYGFSRGNNIGYKYMREHYNLNLLVVTNNDIIFRQKDFIQAAEAEYRKHAFVIMGMDMIDVHSGSHLNPKYKQKSAEEVQEWLKELEERKKRKNLRAGLMYWFQQSRWYPSYVKYIRSKRPDVKRQRELSTQYAVDRVIQGGCMIFSKPFLVSEEHLFWPETSFYCEEDILFVRSMKKGWKVLYSPRLRVFHEQGASFKADSRSIKERIDRGINYNIESAKILLTELENLE